MQEKIFIRKMIKSDLPNFLEIRNLSREYLHDDREFSIEDCIKWFDEKNPVFFVIQIDDNMIGYFRTSNWKENSVYIGADIHPNFRGKGFGYYSYLKFIDFISKNYGFDTLYLEVLSTNTRAINLYKKLGFQITDTSTNKLVRNNKTIDSILMELKIS